MQLMPLPIDEFLSLQSPAQHCMKLPH